MPPGSQLYLLSPLGGGYAVVCPICSVCLWGFCKFSFCNVVLRIPSSFAVAPNRPPGKHINFELIAFSSSGQGSLQSNL